jgi:hypothetical protein
MGHTACPRAFARPPRPMHTRLRCRCAPPPSSPRRARTLRPSCTRFLPPTCLPSPRRAPRRTRAPPATVLPTAPLHNHTDVHTPAYSRACPAPPPSRLQHQRGDDDITTITTARSSRRRRHHPSPSHAPRLVLALPRPRLYTPGPARNTGVVTTTTLSPPTLTIAPTSCALLSHPTLARTPSRSQHRRGGCHHMRSPSCALRPPCPHARNTDVVTTTPRRSHRTIAASSSSPPALTIMPTSRTSRPGPRLTRPSLSRPPLTTPTWCPSLTLAVHVHLLAPILTPPRPLWSTRNACPARPHPCAQHPGPRSILGNYQIWSRPDTFISRMDICFLCFSSASSLDSISFVCRYMK